MDAYYTMRALVVDKPYHCCLNHFDIGQLPNTVTKSHYECTVLYRRSLFAFREGGANNLFFPCEIKSHMGNSVDALEARLEAEFLERLNTTRLNEFARNAVWLGKTPLDESNAQRSVMLVTLPRCKCI